MFFGLAAGVLVLVSVLPYLRDVVKGKTKLE